MITLDELIGCLQKARETHGGNIECSIWITDKEERAMASEGLPEFDIVQDLGTGPDSLAIDFAGEGKGEWMLDQK